MIIIWRYIIIIIIIKIIIIILILILILIISRTGRVVLAAVVRLGNDENPVILRFDKQDMNEKQAPLLSLLPKKTPKCVLSVWSRKPRMCGYVIFVDSAAALTWFLDLFLSYTPVFNIVSTWSDWIFIMCLSMCIYKMLPNARSLDSTPYPDDLKMGTPCQQ